MRLCHLKLKFHDFLITSENYDDIFQKFDRILTNLTFSAVIFNDRARSVPSENSSKQK